MDLKVYYQKIREWETKIVEEFPVVISKETGDGGKAGTLTEVPKAQMRTLISRKSNGVWASKERSSWLASCFTT